MKSKFALLCLFVLLFGVVSIVSVAQDNNNPLYNPDANACFPGGAFAGMCDTLDVDDDGDADSFDSEWCWKCGWYYIRVEYGIFPQEVLYGICGVAPPVVEVEEEKKDDKPKKHREEEPTGGDVTPTFY